MEKQVPLKNYLILFAVIIVTVLAVFYLRNWYIMTRIYNNTSPLLEVVSEINSNEIDNYVMENQNFVIYVSSSTNNNAKSFERKFSKYIVDQGISGDILYINVDTAGDDFSDQLSRYATDTKVKNKINTNSVSMFVFENGKIVNVISDVPRVGLKHIDKLFKGYGLVDNA